MKKKFLGAFFFCMFLALWALIVSRWLFWLFGGCHGYGITGYLRATDTMAPYVGSFGLAASWLLSTL